MAWKDCEHEWEEVDDDLACPGTTTVECRKCQCPGVRDDEKGDVFWPAT